MSEHTNGNAARAGRVTSGLVLGGGGARGLAHIGVLQVLEREGYPIDMLSGTSMGGLAAGLYALTGSSAALLDLAAQPADNEVMRLSRATRPEMFESRGFRRWLGSLFGARTFADLRWPVAVTAVDLDSGEELVINRGPVAPAMWATTSLPGLYAPVGINGRRLVDGGVLNPLPVDVARRLGATVTLAVDVLPDRDRVAARLPAGYPQAMLRKVAVSLEAVSKAFDISLCAIRDARLRECPPDLLITPELHGYSAIDYASRDAIIARGVAAAEAVLPEIRRLRDRLLAAQAVLANGRPAAAGVSAPERRS